MPLLRMRLPVLLAVLPLSIAGRQASAAVTDCTSALPITVNLQNVAVPTSLPVGQDIPGATGNFTATETCVNNTPSAGSSWYLTENSIAAFTLVAGYTDVYTSAGMVAGIGFRLRDRNGAALQTIAYGGGNTTFVMGPANTGTSVIAGTFQLVRTAVAIGSGAGTIALYGHVPSQAWANQNQASSRVNLNYSILQQTVAACAVTQSTVSVTMPAVSASSLPTVGATSGGVGFGIGLNCEANANPRVSMSDATTPSNSSDTLTLASASTAQGVGVQVQYAGQTVIYGPTPFSYNNGATASANSVNLGPQSGTVQIPFAARYVRNGATLQAGSVQAAAIFLLSYQ